MRPPIVPCTTVRFPIASRSESEKASDSKKLNGLGLRAVLTAIRNLLQIFGCCQDKAAEMDLVGDNAGRVSRKSARKGFSKIAGRRIRSTMIQSTPAAVVGADASGSRNSK